MALNIKDAETERLVAEVAERTGKNKTAVVREAVRKELEGLSRTETPEERAERMLRFMETEIWPHVQPSHLGKRITKQEREEILGIGPEGY